MKLGQAGRWPSKLEFGKKKYLDSWVRLCLMPFQYFLCSSDFAVHPLLVGECECNLVPYSTLNVIVG